MNHGTRLYLVHHCGRDYEAILILQKGLVGQFKLTRLLSQKAFSGSLSYQGSVGFEIESEKIFTGEIVEKLMLEVKLADGEKEKAKLTPRERRNILIWAIALTCAAIDILGWTLIILRLYGI